MEKPQIHLFKYNEGIYLFDINTCTPLEINNIAYSVLELYGTIDNNEIIQRLAPQYSEDEVISVLEDIAMLKEKGLLYSSQYEFRPVSPHEASDVKIRQMLLMVAQDCNLGCTYCFGNQGTYGHECIMSEETAMRAIDFMLEQAPKRKEFIVCFFGGEPLMNFSLIEKVLDYCDDLCEKRNIKIYFHMTTNGTILNDRILERIVRHNIVVLISMDGPEEIHDRYRKFKNGKGTFKVIADNVRRISQYIPVHARVTLTKYSPSLTEISKALKEIGITDIYFSAVSKDPTCSSCKNQNFDDMGMSDSQLIDLEAEFNNISKAFTEDHCKEELPYNFLNMMRFKMSTSKRNRGCDCGGSLMAVSADGGLYPCHRFVEMQHFRLGDIWNGLNGELYANFFNEFDKSREKCKRCWAVNTCGGGCASESVIDGSRFGEPNESKCIQMRVQKEGAIYLKMRQNARVNIAK